MPDALTTASRASHVLVGALFLAALAFAAIGAALNDTFYLRLATEALIFGGLALSVDILLGYTGLLSLGQALYFGVGAYISALVLMAMPSFWLAFGAGFFAGLVLGLIGGIIAIRVRGVYFALITFGMAQVVAKVIYNTRALGASDGLMGVPIIDIDLGIAAVSSASPAGFFLVVLAIIALLMNRGAQGRPRVRMVLLWGSRRQIVPPFCVRDEPAGRRSGSLAPSPHAWLHRAAYFSQTLSL